jgi:hypothetical protein
MAMLNEKLDLDTLCGKKNLANHLNRWLRLSFALTVLKNEGSDPNISHHLLKYIPLLS